jgi:hypothetical protein
LCPVCLSGGGPDEYTNTDLDAGWTDQHPDSDKDPDLHPNPNSDLRWSDEYTDQDSNHTTPDSDDTAPDTDSRPDGTIQGDGACGRTYGRCRRYFLAL